VPKDGPSAGVAVTLAIGSVLSRRAVRRDVAMTGEVTLRGKALEIGGVKEKVLAAYRAGLREVILPKSNEKDLRDVPDEVRANMVFTFVNSMDDVFRLALLPPTALVNQSSSSVLADHPPLLDEPRHELSTPAGESTRSSSAAAQPGKVVPDGNGASVPGVTQAGGAVAPASNVA
jgi:hypothetical protein